jgi:proline iminopeptidase
MDAEDKSKMAKLMIIGGYAYCPNGSHLAMWDDQAVYFNHLLNYLRTV